MGLQAPRRVVRMSARYCNDTEAEREHELKAFIPPERNGDLVKRVGSVILRRIMEGNPTFGAQSDVAGQLQLDQGCVIRFGRSVGVPSPLTQDHSESLGRSCTRQVL